MSLPRVGESVRSKRFGTVWKVIEEREDWIEAPADSDHSDASAALVPAIYLRYWNGSANNTKPGRGRTLQYRYSHGDPSFQDHWEILYDW